MSRAVADDAVALALDVGGTKVLGGLVTASGEIRATRRASTTARPGGADPGLRATLGVATALAEESEHGAVVAVGAGFPEYVHDGELRSAEVLAWREQPGRLLADRVPGVSDVPVVVESDVRCGAVAEARLGAGAGYPSVLYLSWGTGISSTLVLDGVPLPGHRGEAIAAGELDVPPAVDPTWTGNLEQYASGQAITARYRASPTGPPSPHTPPADATSPDHGNHPPGDARGNAHAPRPDPTSHTDRDHQPPDGARDIASHTDQHHQPLGNSHDATSPADQPPGDTRDVPSHADLLPGGARDVASRADHGDDHAATVLRTAGAAVGIALAQLVAVLDPAAVVLGGGLGCADTLATRTARETYRTTVARRPSPPPLLPATLGPTAGLVGAALLAHAARNH